SLPPGRRRSSRRHGMLLGGVLPGRPVIGEVPVAVEPIMGEPLGRLSASAALLAPEALPHSLHGVWVEPHCSPLVPHCSPLVRLRARGLSGRTGTRRGCSPAQRGWLAQEGQI